MQKTEVLGNNVEYDVIELLLNSRIWIPTYLPTCCHGCDILDMSETAIATCAIFGMYLQWKYHVFVCSGLKHDKVHLQW